MTRTESRTEKLREDLAHLNEAIRTVNERRKELQAVINQRIHRIERSIRQCRRNSPGDRRPA